MKIKFPSIVEVDAEKLTAMHTDSILEDELIDNLTNEAVNFLRVVQTANGFRIYSSLKWKEGEILLVTQRKHPREWISLDRLVRHMNKHYGELPPIFLHLRREQK